MADTAKTESAQALFCAIADYLGTQEAKRALDPDRYPTYEDFRVNYTPPLGRKTLAEVITESHKKYADLATTNLKDIERVLKDVMWYKSSVYIAREVMLKVDKLQKKFVKIKKFDWSDVYYVRGDKEIMGTIADLFKNANDQLTDLKGEIDIAPFGQINKWCPADIYFASEDAPKMLKDAVKQNLNFWDLNDLISDMMESGDLLPLSLKKSPNGAEIHEVNFDRKKELKRIMSLEFVKILGDDDKRSLKIQIHNDGSTILIRHDPSTGTASGGKFVVEIEMKNSRGGSLTGMVLADIAEPVDKAFARNLRNAINDAKKDFSKQVPLRMRGMIKSKDVKLYNKKLGTISKELASDPVNEVIVKFLKTSKNADRVVRSWVAYASSTTKLSSKFIIAS